MTKQEQTIINEYCVQRYDYHMKNAEPMHVMEKHNLRTCQACVYIGDDVIFLRSYSTIVAFIDKKSREFFDVLRHVYGYTATSAQHISKFKHDYARYFDNSFTFRA